MTGRWTIGWVNRGGVLIVAALAVCALVAGLVAGGETPAILSSVGAAIPTGSGAAGDADRSGGTTGGDTVGSGGTPGGGRPESGVGGTSPALQAGGPQLVRTGSLELVVEDLRSAVERGQVAIVGMGGYVGASQESSQGETPVAVITYRIPAGRWADGLAAIRALATRVRSEQTEATDAGDQLVDLEARTRNLRASETALQGIATATERVSDLLEVERRLSDVRGEIERLDAQRLRLADRVAYGTLVTTYGLEVVAVEQAAGEWDPATEVDRATATLLSAVQGIAAGGIWFTIVWLPFLGLAVVGGLVARWAFRRYGRRGVGSGDGGGAVPGWSDG